MLRLQSAHMHMQLWHGIIGRKEKTLHFDFEYVTQTHCVRLVLVLFGSVAES